MQVFSESQITMYATLSKYCDFKFNHNKVTILITHVHACMQSSRRAVVSREAKKKQHACAY